MFYHSRALQVHPFYPHVMHTILLEKQFRNLLRQGKHSLLVIPLSVHHSLIADSSQNNFISLSKNQKLTKLSGMQAQDGTNTALSNSPEPTPMAKPDHQTSKSSADASIEKRECRPRITGADDEVDVLLKHEDFQRLLGLSVNVQEARKRILASTGRPFSSQQKHSKSSITPQGALQASLRLQSQLLSNPDTASNIIRRGDFPISDAIIDDSISILQRELDDMERLLQKEGKATRQPRSQEPSKPKADNKKLVGKKKEAIAIKYSKQQTDILMTWMIENKDQPFPDQAAIELLMAQTGLSHSQVVNWTTNVRKRNRKATCQGGKKPHHFIDFLFLAHDRETRQQEVAPSSRKSSAKTRSHKKKAETLLLDDEPELYPEQTMSLHEEPAVSTKSASGSPKFALGECFHPSIFDDEDCLEPLDSNVYDIDDNELLKEFADVWLGSGHGTSDMELLGEVGVHDFVLQEHIEQKATADEKALLPSVTDDGSNEDTSPYQALCTGRGRSSSFDLEFEGEDMETWACQLGLSI